MRLKFGYHPTTFAAIAILWVLATSLNPAGETPDASGVIADPPATHNCRFWGAIAASTLDSTVIVNQLITLPQSLENLSPSNRNGWALINFSLESSTPAIRRGLHAAYEDPIYNIVVNQTATDSSRIVMGHVRNCTSGLCDIPNPHPFHRFKNGRHWFLGHNGSVLKEVLIDLIRPEYLEANPPENGESFEEWIDSELYFLYILQTLEDHNWQMAPALGEVVELLRFHIPWDHEQLNFIMTDGQTLWAYRDGISLYYQFNTEGQIYTAVASEYPGEEQNNWTEMEDGQLITLRQGIPPILQHIEDFFTHTATDETPLALTQLSAFPNPFNPTTTVRWILPEAGRFRVTVHDILGRHIATLANGFLEPGEYQRTWRALDEEGHPLSSGVYLLRLKGDASTHTSKLILIR
jgi:predicted glutamine amidotransferase